MALKPSQIRQMLQDNMKMPVDETPPDEGIGAPQQSYNFAPGYYGVVYRASPDVTVRDADATTAPDESQAEIKTKKTLELKQKKDREYRPSYKLQSMKWGIVPSWTKRQHEYVSMLKTINCRDDSLANSGGLWSSMKSKKRCIVLAQGFYEWLQKGLKEKVPHFVKRKDGKLLCMAGLWDCVDSKNSNDLFTFTIITTSSSKQLRFLHDRMPVLFEPGSEELRMWLDPKRNMWSRDLQSLLKAYEGELDVYAVTKDVGKAGRNSPSFMIPVASKENKDNIANFFAKDSKELKKPGPKHTFASSDQISAHSGSTTVMKRQASNSLEQETPTKKQMTAAQSKATVVCNSLKAPGKLSKSPSKFAMAAAGTQKITKYFS